MTTEHKYELGTVLSIKGEEVRIVAKATPYGKLGYLLHKVGSSFELDKSIFNLRTAIKDSDRISTITNPNFWKSELDLKNSNEIGVSLFESELESLGAKLMNENKFKYELGSVFTIDGEQVQIVARSPLLEPIYLLQKVVGEFLLDKKYFKSTFAHSHKSRLIGCWIESLIDLTTHKSNGVHLYQDDLDSLLQDELQRPKYEYELGTTFIVAGEEFKIVARAKANGNNDSYLFEKTVGDFDCADTMMYYGVRRAYCHSNRSNYWKDSAFELNQSNKTGIHLYKAELNNLIAAGTFKLNTPSESKNKQQFKAGDLILVSDGSTFFEAKVHVSYKDEISYFDCSNKLHWVKKEFCHHQDENKAFKVGDLITVKIGKRFLESFVIKTDPSALLVGYRNPEDGNAYWVNVDSVYHRKVTEAMPVNKFFLIGNPIRVKCGDKSIFTKVHEVGSSGLAISYIHPDDKSVYWAKVENVTHFGDESIKKDMAEITSTDVTKFEIGDRISIEPGNGVRIYTTITHIAGADIGYDDNGYVKWADHQLCKLIRKHSVIETNEKDMSKKEYQLGDYVKYNSGAYGDVTGSVVAFNREKRQCLIALSDGVNKSFGQYNGIDRLSDNSGWVIDAAFKDNRTFRNSLLDSEVLEPHNRPFDLADRVRVSFSGETFESEVVGTSFTERTWFLVTVPDKAINFSKTKFVDVEKGKWILHPYCGGATLTTKVYAGYLTKSSLKSKENVMDKDSGPAVSFVARQKSRVAKGVYRAEARQLAKGTRAILVAFLKSQGFKRGEIKFATAMLEHPMGLPILSWGIGELINRVPHLRDNPHCKILEEELQVEAFASGMDLGLDAIREKFEPMVLGILARLPTPPAEMLRVTDAPKVRVQAPTVDNSQATEVQAEQEAVMAEVKKSVATAQVV